MFLSETTSGSSAGGAHLYTSVCVGIKLIFILLKSPSSNVGVRKYQRGSSFAGIAQSGERQTEDLKVPGSIPGHGITLFFSSSSPRHTLCWAMPSLAQCPCSAVVNIELDSLKATGGGQTCARRSTICAVTMTSSFSPTSSTISKSSHRSTFVYRKRSTIHSIA